MAEFSDKGVRDVIVPCDTSIIPIFPVRFAIKENALIDMLNGGSTPATPTNIDDLAHHELLSIRRGYVYVFANGIFHVYHFETQAGDENSCMYYPNTDLSSSSAYTFAKYEWTNGVKEK